jgi:hypothetical protein
MPASTYAGNKVLDLLLRGVAFSAPARVWASLHTADPLLTGANEVSTGAWPAYARQDPAGGGAVGNGFTAASGKVTANALNILFPRHNGASPVTVGWVYIWDALTSGNPLLKAQIVTSGGSPTTKTIQPDDELIIYAGELDFLVD